MLSSIQGAAVTAIQIDGVLHEFSSIKGVREDVTDIVLNVKNLAIKSSSSSAKKIILDIKGPKEVKAKDITLVPEIEILNPEQTICNLDEKTNFHMELMVSSGKGYVQAPKNKTDDSPLDVKCKNFNLYKYSKNYLNHLFNTNEILGSMILTLHNINFYQELMSEIRANITNGTFDKFHDKYINKL